MKLYDLHEETIEGIGLKYALSQFSPMKAKPVLKKCKNREKLAKRIAKAMQNKKLQPKKNIRKQTQDGTGGSLNMPKKSRLATASPVPHKPRHRKYFGIDNPHTPY